VTQPENGGKELSVSSVGIFTLVVNVSDLVKKLSSSFGMTGYTKWLLCWSRK
jgi:hypothetical protein